MEKKSCVFGGLTILNGYLKCAQMERVRNSYSETNVKKQNLTSSTDLSFKTLWDIFLGHPVFLSLTEGRWTRLPRQCGMAERAMWRVLERVMYVFLQNQSLIKAVFAHRGIPEGLPLLKRGRGVLLSQVFDPIQQKTFFKGVVSGGRGTLGECGGVNNPIHYVRVRSLTRWIVDNIGHGSR